MLTLNKVTVWNIVCVRSPGGGGATPISKCPDVCVPGFENVPILNDTVWCKTYP